MLVAAGCKRDESELRKKAELLCRYNQLEKLYVPAFPDDAAPSEYVRADDLGQQRKDEAESGGLAQALMLNLGPTLKLVSDAFATRTNCEVLNISLKGGEADVTVRQSRPDFDLSGGGLGRIGELSKMDTDTAKKKLDDLFKQAKGVETSEHTLHFLKTSDVWRADFQLPEKAALVAQSRALRAEATAFSKSYDFAEAKAKLEEALKLTPADLVLKKELLEAEAALLNVIAGKWSGETSKDAMTDDVNVVVALPSETEIQKSFGTSRPMLYVRCREKKLEVYVALDAVVDGSLFDGVNGRFRFGAAKAESVRLSEAKGGEAVFLPGAGQWVDRFVANEASTFVLEVPLYSGAGVSTFKLAGAKKALARVTNACR